MTKKARATTRGRKTLGKPTTTTKAKKATTRSKGQTAKVNNSQAGKAKASRTRPSKTKLTKTGTSKNGPSTTKANKPPSASPSTKPLRIALTGTPGVGKTTVAALAAKKFGWKVVDVKKWALDIGLSEDYDTQDEAHVVDVEGLSLEKDWEGTPTVTTLYDGHLSHYMPVDVAWVIRCDPDVLRPRLQARGYKPEKVRENLEAEAIDVILQECLARFRSVISVDGTRRSPEETLSAFAASKPKGHQVEPVDWSDRLPV